jgi:hypothetical protein
MSATCCCHCAAMHALYCVRHVAMCVITKARTRRRDLWRPSVPPAGQLWPGAAAAAVSATRWRCCRAGAPFYARFLRTRASLL